MFSAINIGLSGMQAYSKGLQIISNNVTNLNTPGYKAATTSFSDMFNANPGGLSFGGDSGQRGNGVRIEASRKDFTQGTLQQTNGDLDLAIDGRGFLILLDGAKTFYARTGQFFVDQDGFITEQGSQRHLAVLDSGGRPVSLNLTSKRNSPPAATTTVTLTDNLSAGATVANVADVKVFDASGVQHTWQMKLTADTNNPGQWALAVTDESGATIGTSTLKFTGSVIDPSTAKVTVATSGTTPLSVLLDFSSVSSFSTGTTSTIRASKVDGNGVGALSTVTIDADGQVKITYTNGKTELEGAVALADFLDPEQLERVGSGLYENTANAAHRVLSSEVDGVGKLVPKQIEGSNVDLSQEFGQLILIQRGFQASSQVVSVANDMIQQLFGIRAQG